MANVKNHESIYNFFKNHTTPSAESDGVTRWGYDTTTVYITNPSGVPITIQVSPDGSTWFNAAAPVTDISAIVHVTLSCKYMRAVRGAGAGTVTVTACSGSIAHT